MSQSRVIVVSLSGRRPIQVFCTVTDTACHLAEVEYLPSNVKALTKKLVDLKEVAKKANASLVVEDTTGFFAQYGRNLKLSDRGMEGRPVLVTAMSKFTAFEKLAAITYPSGDKSRFSIPQSIYNIKQADNGSVSYEFNWDSLRDEARAMLLSIYAGCCESIYQSSFFDKMINHFRQNGAQQNDVKNMQWSEAGDFGVGVKVVDL